MKLFNKNVLSVTVSMFMTLTFCSSVSTVASDIEIYKGATSGKPSILMMLDTSGSMGISSLVLPKNNNYGSPGDVDTPLCDQVQVSEYYNNRSSTANIYEWTYNLRDPQTNRTAIRKSVTIGGTTIPYYVRGCTKNNVTEFDRLSRLKDAILPLLASTELEPTTKMGLGQFSSKTDLTIGTASNRLTDGHSGRILVANKELDNTQRIKIAREIAAIKSLDTLTNEDGTPNPDLKLSSDRYPNVTKASGGTPTAHAYAEAGAYMLGTNTGAGGINSGRVSTIYDGYMVMQNGNEQAYFICVEVGQGTSSALGAVVKQCVNNWPEYDSRNKTIGAATVAGNYLGAQKSGTVYRPDGKGGWTQIIGQAAFKRLVNNDMNNGWETFSKLPVGWRYGGWMKVAHEPLDIEPIVGTVWSGYAGGTIGIVSYRTNPFLVGGTTDSMVGGFAFSNDDEIKNGSVYKAGGSTQACDGNGIYFLTDGAPNSTKDNMVQTIMNLSLGNHSSYSFSQKPAISNTTLSSPILQSGLFAGETGGWEYIGEYAKKLRNRTDNSTNQKNPADMNIKTAVVGFGSSFAGIKDPTTNTYNCDAVRTTNPDAYNACKWGSSDYGDGGFYYAENSEDIKQSILNFVEDAKHTFEPVATGSPTIPVDSLNPVKLQPYGYYASFTPKPQDAYQLWLGNLNKYDIYNGEIGRARKQSNGSVSFSRLINERGTLNNSVQGFWSGGALTQLALGTSSNQGSNRTIYTNREISSGQAVSDDDLHAVNLVTLFDPDADKAKFNDDPDKKYWLNLLGYDIPVDNSNIDLATVLGLNKELRQMGSVMHSAPVLLTQEGKIEYANGQLTTTNRKDYLMYGSTQGLLHVLDSATGKEVFAFVPNEMMSNQKGAFLAEDKTSGGKSNLFYGIDAPWVAYTQYVSKEDGTLTVKDANRKVSDDKNSLNLKGIQWVYGGLRMGGRSYYSLDLSDIEKPSLKFHINPDAADASNALKNMGQSWSKPSLGYINWGGQRKLVMFVGGGYDADQYENPLANPASSKGNGVYMFDAENGDLLWWTSSTSASGAEQQTVHSDMKYSVVSQINAIDRDGDGLTDHLYFGDLGGQAFRVDLNNNANDAADFAKRVIRLFSEHSRDGKSPRFYEMPTMTIHTDDGDYFAAVSFSSGNRSSPLASDTQSARDGVFVVFDNDVTRRDIYSNINLNTRNVSLASLVLKTGVPRRNANGGLNSGWKYQYSLINSRYKGMNEIYALDGMLYVNVYDRDGAGLQGACGSGVAGDSYLYQFCLPSGKCDFYNNTVTEPNRVKLGAGILGAGLGKGYGTANDNTVGLVVNRDQPNALDCQLDTNKNLPECQLFDNSVGLQQLRWYESR